MRKLLFIFIVIQLSYVFAEDYPRWKGDSEPSWAANAIWYQIFPERFWNGDTGNDPDLASLAGTWPYDTPCEWEVCPWTDDWYKLQPWEEACGRDFYYNAQLRRYGGDLQGIIDNLDYLQDLGVNALYLNPIFESPSSHKYGAVYYHHVDNNFGPNPASDAEMWAMEYPADPSTWTWTSADLLFLELIKQVHERGMKIIIDGVFNHVGIPFWALEDVRENGRMSEYAEWFTINSWDDPNTPEDEFDYDGWYGIRDLPELREDENGLIRPIAEHIYFVVRRWMDPNRDGDPSDGIDGWRLDVAEMVDLDFWKTFRKWVTDINPDAYLTGEVWWEDYMNQKMFNAKPWLEGDAFHSVMNYRFADAAYQFLSYRNQQIGAAQFAQMMEELFEQYGYDTILGIQNLYGSHDTERFASAIVNPDRMIDHANNLNHNPEFKVRAPNAEERQIQELMLALQFTMPGAPYIYYGDEAGMWGADDPDERKPMVWESLQYETESHHPKGLKRQADSVAFNRDIFEMYKKFTKLRKENPALTMGSYQCRYADDRNQIFAFTREFADNSIVVVMNASEKEQHYPFSEILPPKTAMKLILGKKSDADGSIPGKSFQIFREIQ